MKSLLLIIKFNDKGNKFIEKQYNNINNSITFDNKQSIYNKCINDFKLYKMIARNVHNHTPQSQLSKPIFSAYEFPKKQVKSKHRIINIDKINYSSNFQNISSNIKNDLDWKCKTNFDSGIIKTIKWYLDNFENNFFKNKQFSKRMGLDT